MKVFGITGWSGSGKTTLMVKLLPEMIKRGYSVSTMKHTHHRFDLDRKGKDSFEHRQAGASEVLVSSSNRWALMHELRGVPEPDMDELIAQMTPVDLLLVEGFKGRHYDKLEVSRQATGKPLRCREDEEIVALACDSVVDDLDIPVIDINDIAAIADFIVACCGLEGGKQ
ncbi:MAG: molybdopterin-guanine dinucleotide biosynthesis protein B [Rhodospirillaceae bacterium]|jgi:molybdopterin-guanine dinucleotide biosynthesis adapter protein|nr:molybdopterin-guanine dinucleotide biosynthesis protein B [Rhodospirillaceae bacterium]MBT5243580.1 molybdopterin-guanine dinucleotide biosynthesis protein B [Rhodospirillaceae bacterium]MBT5562168.1 molybdopterin-guanine dinucleotide biosynthesis protein B [Rhodospirillaceae bacterium]MBT6242341.1 molybdopterin-guanine dinucleotide biosynthesis protein B [Rhodospirillaceae bacterium]MBT7138953.1 molybdopterin-guanine dinucleotide biosynthesis protein B [Rhodospirillaceae bacterium]